MGEAAPHQRTSSLAPLATLQIHGRGRAAPKNIIARSARYTTNYDPISTDLDPIFYFHLYFYPRSHTSDHFPFRFIFLVNIYDLSIIIDRSARYKS
jgi:hypothetical protein